MRIVYVGLAVLVALGAGCAQEPEAESNYVVASERAQSGGECETLYLEVAMPDDRAIEELVDEYDGETDAAQAIIYENEEDIESPDALPTGNLRASYSGCGEAATGIPAGEFEYSAND